jgi:hypothetical protein
VSRNKINSSLSQPPAEPPPSSSIPRCRSLHRPPSSIPESVVLVVDLATKVANPTSGAIDLDSAHRFDTSSDSLQDPLPASSTNRLQAAQAAIISKLPSCPLRPQDSIRHRPRSSLLATIGNLRANFAPFGASVQQHPPRRRCSSIVVSETPLQPQLSEAGGPFRPDVCNVSQRRRPHRRVRWLLWGSGFVSCRDLSVIGSFVKGLIVSLLL